MNKTDIDGKQMATSIGTFLVGSSLLSSGADQARQDTWLCIIFSIILMLPVLWVYSEILKLYPGQNFYQNILRAMGRPVGTVVCLIFALFAFLVSAQVLITFADFVHIVNMTETPLIAVLTGIVATLIYILSKRLYVLTRICKFVGPFILITVIMTMVLSYKDMDTSNIRPILQLPPKLIIQGTLTSLVLPYGEIVALLPMFGALDRKEKIFPTIVKGMILGFNVLIIADLRNLLVLGYSTTVYFFPSYEAVSVIKLGEFFTRIEVLIGINLLLAGALKAGILLFSACKGISEVCGFRHYKPLIGSIGLLLLTAAELVQSDTMEMVERLQYYPIFALPIEIVLPVIVLIVGKIRKRYQTPQKIMEKKVAEEKQKKETAGVSPQES